jgi:cupin fold WbuC family metalloprotein
VNPVTAEFLDELVARAAASARRRQHFNLHADPDEPCQRLLNAVWPDSYIRPHQHTDAATPECLLALRGTFALVEFHEDGAIADVELFGEGATVIVVQIPPKRWHTVLALTEGAILFEAKSGPYRSESAKCFADWAPPEDDPGRRNYLAGLRRTIDAWIAAPRG